MVDFTNGLGSKLSFRDMLFAGARGKTTSKKIFA